MIDVLQRNAPAENLRFGKGIKDILQLPVWDRDQQGTRHYLDIDIRDFPLKKADRVTDNAMFLPYNSGQFPAGISVKVKPPGNASFNKI